MYVLKLIKFQKLTLYSLFSVSLYFLLGVQIFEHGIVDRKDSREDFLRSDHCSGNHFKVTATANKKWTFYAVWKWFVTCKLPLQQNKHSNRVDTIWIVLVIGSSIKKIDNPVLQMFPLVLRPVTFFLMKRFDLTLFHYQKMKTELWLNLLILCTVIKCSLSFKSLVPFISFMSPNLLLKHS